MIQPLPFQFAKGSFEIHNEYALVAFAYKTQDELNMVLSKLSDMGFQYDGIFSPIQNTDTLCNYADYYFNCSHGNPKLTSYKKLTKRKGIITFLQKFFAT